MPNASGQSLSNFASQFDQTTERSYTEEGAHRNNYYQTIPKKLETLFQEPDVTVLVKKRVFASLSENFRTDLFDRQEKLFFRATKKLLSLGNVNITSRSEM